MQQRLKEKSGINNEKYKLDYYNENHNNKVNDYMNKAARKVIDYCITNDIGTLVVGYNETFQLDTIFILVRHIMYCYAMLVLSHLRYVHYNGVQDSIFGKYQIVRKPVKWTIWVIGF